MLELQPNLDYGLKLHNLVHPVDNKLMPQFLNRKYFRPLAQRGVAHLLPLLILTFGVGVGVFLVREPRIFFSNAQSDGVCIAADAPSFSSCISKLNNKQISEIEVTNLITCSGSNACNFPDIRSTHNAQIFGTPGKETGLRRTDNYNYKTVKLSDSSNLKILNLNFDDLDPRSCKEGSCLNSHISINGGSNITLDNLKLLNSQNMGVAASRVRNLTVKNSRIANNGWFGIWTDQVESINIENNLFQDNKSNAILGSFKGSTSTPSRIYKNTFIHNHRDSIFFACDGGSNPCPGGQIDITSPTQNLAIEKNIFRDGKIDAYDSRGLGASGIELNGNTQNLTIKDNAIYNNTGAGIILNPGERNFSNINILNNVVFNNKWGNIIYDGANIIGNCTDSNCQIPQGLGASFVSNPDRPAPIQNPTSKPKTVETTAAPKPTSRFNQGSSEEDSTSSDSNPSLSSGSSNSSSGRLPINFSNPIYETTQKFYNLPGKKSTEDVSQNSEPATTDQQSQAETPAPIPNQTEENSQNVSEGSADILENILVMVIELKDNVSNFVGNALKTVGVLK